MSHALQVYLEDPEFQALRAWADERGWSLSQAVRVALKALTQPRDTDPLLASSGMIDGLPADLSQRFDDYLTHTFVAEPPSRSGEQKKRVRRANKPVRR